MSDKTKTILAILIFFLSLIAPVTGLLYGYRRWDGLTILLVMAAIFIGLFSLGVLILLRVKDFSWLTASLPFLFSGFYTVLPDLPGSIDDTAVTTAGALITYFFALRRNPATPKWVLIPLLAAAAYTFFGGAIPGAFDEVIVDILALLIAGMGVRTADKKTHEEDTLPDADQPPSLTG